MIRSRQQKGMTLLELMIAVAIIGILASVAIPSFRNYQFTSRTAEAKSNLGALARTEKAHYAEFGVFVSVPPEPGFTLAAAPTSTKRSSAPLGPAFADLGWIPEGDVFYDYGTQTDADGLCLCPAGNCFTATAYGDVDGDTNISAILYAEPDSAGNMCGSLIGLPPIRPNEPIRDPGNSRF